MKHYQDIHVGMQFISGIYPNKGKDHRHLIKVVAKSDRVDILKIIHVKCLEPIEEQDKYCKGVLEREFKMSSKQLGNIEKNTSFQWLDTEVAQILYERD